MCVLPWPAKYSLRPTRENFVPQKFDAIRFQNFKNIKIANGKIAIKTRKHYTVSISFPLVPLNTHIHASHQSPLVKGYVKKILECQYDDYFLLTYVWAGPQTRGRGHWSCCYSNPPSPQSAARITRAPVAASSCVTGTAPDLQWRKEEEEEEEEEAE